MIVTDGTNKNVTKIYNLQCTIAPQLQEWILKDGYYQDRGRVWKYDLTTSTSYKLLCNLSHEAEKLLNINLKDMESSEINFNLAIQEGKDIYDKKPALSEHGVTWSQEDYDHLGFIREYIRYKSIQRFTETWTMLVRAHNRGILHNLPLTVNVVSLAGGPGFELYTFREFFKVYYPNTQVKCTSFDLAGAWQPYAEALDIKFELWNSDKETGYFDGIKIDIAIVSYALEMYMSTPFHIKWLSRSIKSERIPLLFVNSRKKNLEHHIYNMTREGVKVVRLLNSNHFDKRKIDDRQIVYYNWSKRFIKPEIQIDIMFPNVPFIK
jgi:hypothetical protein